MTDSIDRTLAGLARLIADRATASPETSYTAKLLAKGPRRIAKKFGEEAVEATIAAVAGDKDNLREEAADVLYHLLVMLHVSGVTLDEVAGELGRREARSGLDEKASRPKE